MHDKAMNAQHRAPNASAEDLISIYGAEDHDQKVFDAAEVPNSYEAITPEWLTSVFCSDVPGGKVINFDLGERDDGSANRRRMTLDYNRTGTDAGLPTAIFCKSADQLQNRQILGPSGVALGEVNFYNKVGPDLDIEIPECYYSNLNPHNYAFMIMLADLSDTSTLADEDTDMDRARAVGQMELLAKLHARYYGSPSLGSRDLPFRTWPQTWQDMMSALPLWANYADKGFEDSQHLMSSALFQRRSEIWPATERSIALHNSLPPTLTHCDVHLKNWYVTNTNKMGLLDWQITSVGHWSRDVIYALTTALTVENRRAWENELVCAYLDALSAHGGPRISSDDAWTFLRPQLLSALAFWTITFRPAPGMPEYHPEKRSVEFLTRLYAAIDDHSALDSFK